MSRIIFNLSFLIILLFGLACTNTKWIVTNEEEIDRTEYKLLDSKFYIEKVGEISPQNPILNFSLKSANTYEYTQRVKTERYIQTYRPRLGFTMFGIAGASLTAYAALSDNLLSSPTTSQKTALLSTSGVLVGISMLNMKETGEPTPTGETKLLRKSGVTIVVDTLGASSSVPQFLQYSIKYNGKYLFEDDLIEFSNNSAQINLLRVLNPDDFPQIDTAKILIESRFNGEESEYEIPLSNIFETFVVIKSPVTALRNSPIVNPNNVLTDLAEGSQLKVVEKDLYWIKVLYGVSENWVSAQDVITIWRPTTFSRQLSVVAIPNVPFGAVDVEINIPKIIDKTSTNWAFILANKDYETIYPDRVYADRDAQLMEEYLKQSLGVPIENVIKLTDATSESEVLNFVGALKTRIGNLNDESSITVYLSGYAELDENSNSVLFLGTKNENSEFQKINLNTVLQEIARIRTKSISIIADLDFPASTNGSQLNQLGNVLTNSDSRTRIIFSSKPGQRSQLYSSANGEKNRHSIFTYFFAKGLKTGNSDWQSMLFYLNRNVTFTARSIHDTPQEIVFFGDFSGDVGY